MTPTPQPSPILRTKLYRPPVTEDYVSRPDLEHALNHSLTKPLTVVVAPAGYGKSTLVSAWEAQSAQKSAWLSLDDSDSDQRVFVAYLLAAIRTVEPDFGTELQGLVDAEVLPAPEIIAVYLCNELESLDEGITLVLDDYHNIRDQDIHRLLDALLKHPPAKFHLVISSRRDPAISLQALRAHNEIVEIRMRQLLFSEADTGALLDAGGIKELDTTVVKHLHERTEGWPAGIRLAMLASIHRENPGDYLNSFGSKTRHFREYILQDLIEGLPDSVTTGLMSAAVLDQFCAPLCEACIANQDKSGDSGLKFMDFVRQSGLPIVPLDDEGNWYRFHHLFNELLRRRLDETTSQSRIREIHQRAANWLAENRYVEEAIQHSLAAENVTFAIELVDRFRHQRMADDEWPRLERWLKLFDPEIIEQCVPLTILECWLDLSHRYELANLFERLPTARQLLERADMPAKDRELLSLELDVLDCPLGYVSMDSANTAKWADAAISNLPPDREYVRSTALMYRAGACQINGDIAGAEDLIQRHITSREFQNPNSTARMLQALCFVYWADGDTDKLEAAASRLIDVSSEHKLLWSLSFGHYFAGVADYDRDNVDSAIAHLSAVVERKHHYPIQNVAHCSFLLSRAHEARSRVNKAERIANDVSQFCLERANPQFIGTSEAFAAEFAARRSNNSKARKWMENYQPEPGMILHRFFHPEVAWLKVGVSVSAEELRPQIDNVADQLLGVMARSSHHRLKIDVLGIQAILARRDGDNARAAKLLSEAVQIGQPGHLIRPLADLGPEVAGILTKLELNREGLEYIGQIIAAIDTGSTGSDTETARSASLPDALSDRESEVLGLMAKGHSNNEIGAKLFISPGTVKRHAHNIFGKLAVSSRREAVAKAKGLGILSSG